jgi:GTP pyrophosphokinase
MSWRWRLIPTAAVIRRERPGSRTRAARPVCLARFAWTPKRCRTREPVAQGSVVGALVAGVESMAPIQALRVRADAVVRSADKAAQLEALRKMLLAMVQDVRVVLIKLADQIQMLRYLIGNGSDDARREAARDTFELLAPLANRLGVWQIKWELEDLAFRCQDPETYRSIARSLDEKRIDREAYIAAVMDRLREALGRAGIQAEISGRPKHIHSIWKKMQRKGVGFEQLSDVRAVRVLVADLRECYTALGAVHQLWTPIPGEFDDYIAKPKSNDYRSLHTAVVGPEDKVLEVQIRTHEMHQHAELGVAAHWRYKESAPHDAAYDQKLSWLRQILDWRDELADAVQLAESFRSELREDSVYVLTPQGRVIDLPRGATPVDFAYHVHTELGHRCRGAKVNGQMVPLHHRLANGQVVEIVAAKEGGPSRDWLNPQLGYLRSNRSRAKVRQWFNSQALEEAITHGRGALEKDLHRLGRGSLKFEELARLLGYPQTDALFLAYQRGEISPRELQAAACGETTAERGGEPSMPGPAVQPRTASPDGILVVGVDRLLTSLARCCKPAPPDPIVGFVSRGRGMTVHRAACPNLARLPPERVMPADWGRRNAGQRFPVDVELVAGNAPGLLRDVLDVLSREKVRVVSSSSVSRDQDLRMLVTLEVADLGQLARLLASIRELPGVAGVRRP